LEGGTIVDAQFPLAWNMHWVQIVLQAWADEAFKKRLLANPTAVLKENGIPVPDGIEIKAVENTSTVVYLTLPAKPEAAVSKEVLDKVTSDASLGDILRAIGAIIPPVAPIIGSIGI
jgi:hypothetical protein